MFEPKVMNCGNYKCGHCSSRGRCNLNKISIGTDGKCSQYTNKQPSELIDNDPDKEFYPYTNVC